MRHTSLVVMAACTAEVPDTPSFQQDILPILAANCIRCHGDPPLGGAPSHFRLDAFEDMVVRDDAISPTCGDDLADPVVDGVVCGAGTMARLSATRLRDPFYPMPPRFSLDDPQIETFERWATMGGRGAPRPGNHAPVASIEELLQIGTVVHMRVHIEDSDRDVVSGMLLTAVDGQPRRIGALRSGTLELRWESSGIAAGTYPLTATLDDGSENYDIQLAPLTIRAP
jgi:hypothetical protein